MTSLFLPVVVFFFRAARSSTRHLQVRARPAAEGEVRGDLQTVHGTREEVRQQGGHRGRHRQQATLQVRGGQLVSACALL